MINTAEIPQSAQLDIAEAAFNAAKKFFENPDNMKAYEKWAEERRKANA